MIKDELKKQFTKETGLFEVECNSSKYADWLEQKATNDHIAIELLKGFVGLADKWIPHWNQSFAFKAQVKLTREFLSRAL